MFKKAADVFNSVSFRPEHLRFLFKNMNMLIHYETNIAWKVCFSLAQRSSFQDSCTADRDDAQSDYQPTFG